MVAGAALALLGRKARGFGQVTFNGAGSCADHETAGRGPKGLEVGLEIDRSPSPRSRMSSVCRLVG